MIFVKLCALSSLSCVSILAQSLFEPLMRDIMQSQLRAIEAIRVQQPPGGDSRFRRFDGSRGIVAPFSSLTVPPSTFGFLPAQVAARESENDTLLKTIRALVNNDQKWMNQYLADEKKQARTTAEQIQYRKKAIEVLKSQVNHSAKPKKK